jgi:hypothetical protein
MPVVVLGADGTGQDTDIIEGVVYAADHGADVILMAFSNPGYSPALQAAIDYAWAHGAVIVAAAGNDGSAAVTYPAGDRAVVGVAATNQDDALAGFSNYGQAAFMAAPGVDIQASEPGGTRATISGTSAAAAHVAGSAALLAALDPAATNGTVVGRLARNADPLSAGEAGNGRLNLARAARDTLTDEIQPAGAAPVGSGGPVVGPYRAADTNITSATIETRIAACASVSTAFVVGDTVCARAVVTGVGGGGGAGQFFVQWRPPSGPVTNVPHTVPGSAPATFDDTMTAGISGNWVVAVCKTTGCSGGNEVATAPFTVAADTAGPVTSASAVAPSPANAAPTVTATETDATSNVVAAEYFINAVGANGSGTAMSAADGSFNSSTENVTGTLTVTQFNALGQGTHTIFVHGRDAAGNWGATQSATFVKDTETPDVTIEQAGADPTFDPAMHFTVQFTELVTDFDDLSDIVLTGTGTASVTSISPLGGNAYDVLVTGTADGTIVATVPTGVASDTAGNVNNASTSTDNSVLLDTAPPTSTASVPDYETSTSFLVGYVANDPGANASGLDTLELWVDTPAAGSYALALTDTSPAASGSFNYTATDGDGTYKFYTVAYDLAGNVELTPNADFDSTLLDTAPPIPLIAFPADGGTYSEASWNAGCLMAVCGTASDPGTSASGVYATRASMQRVSTGLYWDGTGFNSLPELFFGTGSTSWSMAFAYANFPATGQYVVHARSTDNAGNVGHDYAAFQLNRYTIDYLSPLDDSIAPSVVKNTGKAGRVIPVKVDVFLEGVKQTSTQISAGDLTIKVFLMPTCSADVTDTVEMYADAGSSNGNTDDFRWSGDSWIYNLDTKALHLATGSCYRLDVYLVGVKISTQRFAVFQPTK